MKKLFAIVLAAGLVVASLAGCSPSSSESSSKAESTAKAENETKEEEKKEEAATEEKEETPAAETKEESETSDASGEAIKVGITLMNTDSEWQSQMADFIVQYLTDGGFEPTLVSADSDAAQQMEQMENFATMGCKVIVAQIVDPDGAESMIHQIREQGIKMVCIVFTPKEYDGLIRADQAGCGHSVAELAADWVNETYPDAEEDSIEVGLLIGNANADMIERCDALYDIEDLAPQCKVTVATELENANDSAQAMTATENMFISNPNIKVILGYNSACGLGANNYVTSEESPVKDLSTIGIFCNDVDQEVAAALKASVDNKAAIRAVNVINGGTEGVAKRVLFVVSGLMDGSLPEGYIYYSETDKVYPENVDDFIS